MRFYPAGRLNRTSLVITTVILITQLVSCHDDDSSSDDGSLLNDSDSGGLLEDTQTELSATIRRTTNGIPHIKSDSLEGVAYGAGYVQAQDNICLLAEQIIKARSERSKYFGPGDNNQNVISDFSYKALNVLEGAEAEYLKLSPESLALMDGFAAGYNRYVSDTAPDELPAQCTSAPWVKTIRPQDLQASTKVIGLYASGDLFAYGALFLGVPPGVSPMPDIRTDSAMLDSDNALEKIVDDAERSVAQLQINDDGFGSNAWGIGGELSENGKGALLANPHFPYTGARRFYQMHLTVPGYLNIHGAGLTGTSLPLIGFNDNLGWSHTVSTSRQFTFYELTLKEGDDLVYIKDGIEKPISRKTLSIEVANGTPEPTTLERDFFYSEYGPMVPGDEISGGALGAWGDDRKAYTYRDANADMSDFLDTWLGLSRSKDLAAFQQVFMDCGNTRWTNTTYADDQGNAFYIDSSAVPSLSSDALMVLELKKAGSSAFRDAFNSGLTLLDGSTSRDDWQAESCNGLASYEERPKLVRTDFVQNSNDSYWSTNPQEFLTGFSSMFGSEETELTARTRLGLTMVQNPLEAGLAQTPPGGQDGKFNANDLINVIYNNRSFHAETLLSELLDRCALIGDQPVATESGERAVSQACTSLNSWNGVFDIDSVGAHVFRVFMAQYVDDLFLQQTVAFDAADPVGTPSTPTDEDRGGKDDSMLGALARASDILEFVSIPYDATLGSVQRIQKSGGVPPGAMPEFVGDAIAWHGARSFPDGGFNVVQTVGSDVAEDTLFPRIPVETLQGTGGLAAEAGVGWLIDRGTSWHFGLEFGDEGPLAYGLLSYSQSTNPDSPYFNDQSQRYSEKNYGQLFFSDTDIESNLETDGTIELVGMRLEKERQ